MTGVITDQQSRHAHQIGTMLADHIVLGAPPPWDEDWFARVYQNAIDVSAVVFREKYAIADDALTTMQLRFCDGFEGRLKQLCAGGLPQGGTA